MLISAPKIENTNGPSLWFHRFRRPWIYTAHWVHISNRCWNVYVPERPEPCSILLWPFVKFDFLSKYFKLWLNSEILVLSDSRWKYNYCVHENVVKVNSVPEACAKCFAVHILKFEILQTTWKHKTNSIKMLNLLVKN